MNTSINSNIQAIQADCSIPQVIFYVTQVATCQVASPFAYTSKHWLKIGQDAGQDDAYKIGCELLQLAWMACMLLLLPTFVWILLIRFCLGWISNEKFQGLLTVTLRVVLNIQ